MQGRNGLAVTASRTRYQIFDRKRRSFGGHWFSVTGIATKITRQRSQIRYICLPTAGCAAGASWSIDAQWYMTKFSRNVMSPAQNLSINYDAYSNSVRDTYEGKISRVHVATSGPNLRKGASATGVLHVHWQPCCGRKRVFQVNVAPGQRRRMQYAARSRVSHPGHNNADTLARGDGTMVFKNNFDLLAQIRDQAGQVWVGREVSNTNHWLAK